MKRHLLLASVFGLLAAGPALASSHREAPMIAGMPRLDGTDFYMFNSYDPSRAGYVTIVANYIPLEDPFGGPNFFEMDHSGYYDIDVDNQGRGTPTFAFRFRFHETTANLSLSVGGQTVAIPLINDAPVSASSTAGQNTFETYTVSLVNYNKSGNEIGEQLIADATGRTVFPKPLDNIGDKSIPDYQAYANSFIYTVNIPGCASTSKVFVGQRKDPFVANLGETFDLINYQNPVGIQYNASAIDDLAKKNVTAIEMEVPAGCLTTTGDPVVGAWTTSYAAATNKMGVTHYQEVSRLGNPLVNELVIGLKDKDTWNSSVPINDGQFLNYVAYPTLPALIQSIFGTLAPTAFPRTDLEAVFLTGLAGVNAPVKLLNPAEEMRLNTSIAPTPYGSQNNLGVIAGDNAGYPNGRRPGDDVVDISLQVVMGRLYTLGLFGVPGDAPSGGLYFTDGAYTDDTHYDLKFPYLRAPLSDSPQPIHVPATSTTP